MIKWNNYINATFIRREKRFFAYMNINGEEVQCYCPNTGKMKGLLIENSPCILSEKPSGIKYQWEAVFINNTWIGTNTNNPNKLANDAIDYLIKTNQLEPGEKKHEVKYDHFRVDYQVGNQLIEVKNVHWVVNDCALFPDCVTERGARQLNDMIELLKKGFKCYNLYILQRNDCKNLSIAPLDTHYYNNSLNAKSHGIKSFAFNCSIDQNGISIYEQIDFVF